MGGIKHNALTIVKRFINYPCIVEHHATAHIFIADMQQLYGFDKIVGEMVIKLFLYYLALELILIRKTLCKVLPDNNFCDILSCGK